MVCCYSNKAEETKSSKLDSDKLLVSFDIHSAKQYPKVSNGDGMMKGPPPFVAGEGVKQIPFVTVIDGSIYPVDNSSIDNSNDEIVPFTVDTTTDADATGNIDDDESIYDIRLSWRKLHNA